MIGRRSFLTGLGAGLALPFLPWQRALAQEGGVPKRLVAFFTPNGTIPASWASGTGTDFTLGTILQPLRPFREKLLLLDGLDMECTYEGPGGGHQRGIGGLLTGRKLQPGDFVGGNGETSAGWADGISVDQHIANAAGSETRFASLALGVQLEGANNRHRLSMAGAGQPVPTEDDPYNLFDLVFADMSGSTQENERRLRRRNAALAHVRRDLEALQGRLTGEERVRLQQHQASLDDVVSRLGIDGGGPACVIPTVAAGLGVDDRALYPEIGRINMDLLYQALACDLTRVATLLWAGATSSHRFTFLDPSIDESHHSISHEDSAAAIAKLVRINTWYAQQLAYFLDLLEQTPEGDGTMLDNTLVLWGSDLAIGNTHSRRDLHLVMAGNLAGHFHTGRYMHYDGRAHNDLLVTICQAFGLSDDAFGKPDLCSGPIEDLLA